jgi:hypothetical protein
LSVIAWQDIGSPTWENMVSPNVGRLVVTDDDYPSELFLEKMSMSRNGIVPVKRRQSVSRGSSRAVAFNERIGPTL